MIINPYCGEFIGDNYTPETPINSYESYEEGVQTVEPKGTPIKKGVNGLRVLKYGIIAQSSQHRSNVTIREARLKILVVD